MSYKIVKLGEICDFQGGSQPPKSKFIFEFHFAASDQLKPSL